MFIFAFFLHSLIHSFGNLWHIYRRLLRPCLICIACEKITYHSISRCFETMHRIGKNRHAKMDEKKHNIYCLFYFPTYIIINHSPHCLQFMKKFWTFPAPFSFMWHIAWLFLKSFFTPVWEKIFSKVRMFSIP